MMENENNGTPDLTVNPPKYAYGSRFVVVCWSFLLKLLLKSGNQYSDVKMRVMASQITGVASICSIVCSDQRKYQTSASVAFVRETTGDWWIPLTKGQ